jgi:hypothetical protein
MAAISKADLEILERKHGLEEDGLTYQQRLSRITKIQRGESWEPTEKKSDQRRTIEQATQVRKPKRLSPTEAFQQHPLYGKRLLITPMMVPDKNRSLYFDEPLGHEIEVEEVSAGKLLYDRGEEVDRMVGDYRIISENKNKIITAKTTLPKSGQEISWKIGHEIVPVVKGNDGQRGYIWSFPTHTRQFGDTMIQLYGLKTLITQIYPELLQRFSGKPVMMYVDALVLAASIPLTDAILKEHRRKELQNARLGLD